MEKLIKSYTITPPSAKTEVSKTAPASRKTQTFAGKDFFRKPQTPVYSGGQLIMSVESQGVKTETISQRVLRLKNEPMGVLYDDPTQMMDDLHK
jgi:hypothetical protein